MMDGSLLHDGDVVDAAAHAGRPNRAEAERLEQRVVGEVDGGGQRRGGLRRLGDPGLAGRGLRLALGRLRRNADPEEAKGHPEARQQTCGQSSLHRMNAFRL